jgi:Transposase DNA-binding
LGQSKGRGRDDPQRRHAQSLKDVWVYELCPQARQELQACRVEPVAPRSVFAPALQADWAAEEMAGVDLGDQRLNARAQRMLAQRWQRPTSSFYRSFDTPSQASLAYKLVENPRYQISLGSLLGPHQLQTARRMAAEKMVLMAQDTTGLSYHTLSQTQGLRGIGVQIHPVDASSSRTTCSFWNWARL